MASVKELVKRRGLAKAKLTRITNFVDGFEEGSDIIQIRLRSERLPSIWQEYDEIQLQLELEENEEQDDDRESFENRYYDVLGRIENILEGHAAVHDPQSANSASGQSKVPSRNLKLPCIKLPIFCGAATEFKHFHDTFKSLVINNDAVDDIQRYHYLLSSLSGEAHRLIENIPITADNFEVAWEIICKRYDNPKLIASAHIKKLFSLSPMNKDSAYDLRGLLNQVISNYNALKALKLDVPLHEVFLSHLLLEKLDLQSSKEWEVKTSDKECPAFNELIEFLENRCQALELVKSKQGHKESVIMSKQRESYKQARNAKQIYVTTSNQCQFCLQNHPIHKCTKFIETTTSQRREFVKQKNLCFNCLRSSHKSNDCRASNCHTCGKKHHTLLHVEFNGNSGSPQPQYSSRQKQEESRPSPSMDTGENQPIKTMPCCSWENRTQTQVLLSTAIIQIRGNDGNIYTCRALLDSCSQANFVTEAFVQRLKLQRRRINVPIQGINTLTSTVKHCATVQIHSIASQYTVKLECLVLPKISGDIPCSHINTKEWNIPSELLLADPRFNHPGRIDMLIGAEIFFSILKPRQKVLPGPYPVLQDSELGWIIAGRYEIARSTVVKPQALETFLATRSGDIEDQLQRFWEMEEWTTDPVSSEEAECEEHFMKNTVRDHTGRFVVRLPFRQNPTNLGESQQIAASRLHHLERRLDRNRDLKEEYARFLEEYETLGHMKAIDDPTAIVSCSCYLPHHHVQKDSSTTTKTRVVFDASAKTSNGLALNDILMVGPTVQEDLHSIIIRFRSHNVAFTADINKMYRQIRVDPRDCKVQRILWRKSSELQMKVYELQTVTYGTATAPFLATRCLKALANEESSRYPEATAILSRDFYVDDCISGCKNVEDAVKIQNQLQLLLKSGGFELRKWSSNSAVLLNNIPPELRETQIPLRLDGNEKIKTLGLLWHPGIDKLQIVKGNHEAGISKCGSPPTKRQVLSTIASIFDPLGLISPIVILGKILLQQLWLRKLSWDEVIPESTLQIWQEWYGQLHKIDQIRIDRQVTIQGTLKYVELHGFADASEKAYGACIYIRSTNEDRHTAVRLLCSKSKVAPVKRISVPRLELCAALLLARMYKKVRNAVNMTIDDCVFWTDSTVVLTWIGSCPTKWKTFVANRVSEIQEITFNNEWRHVPTRDNPADIITRGATADALHQSNLWWNRPRWLLQESTRWPTSPIPSTVEDVPESKVNKTVLVTVVQEDITLAFSDLNKLQRVIAYVLRFAFNSRCQPAHRRTGLLTVPELKHALTVCVRSSQASEYSSEITDLQTQSSVANKSKIKSLYPFVCQEGILRVGGRLQASRLPFEQRHQAILHPKHHLTKLLIESEHKKLLHGGCQLVHASLRQSYWIVNGRDTIRKVIHNCLICHKLKANTAKQLMGQLPHYRVQPSRPFMNTGIDYAGPFIIKSGSRRTKIKMKCYVSVFVCLCTKAVHLEAVSDMTSQAFLAALKRFIARRGKCSHIYSDNGTNFVGAAREIQELLKAVNAVQQSSSVKNYVAQQGMQWHFIPPRAPHFGGIWEAGVKSFKYHLRRIMGNSFLTFEELTTILAQIEACLNSRPLMPLSNDPTDPLPLTPGHFLIGAPLTSLPEPDTSDTRLGLLSRWQQLQQRVQQFWKTWSNDYLSHLQQRAKWSSTCDNIQPGTIVLLKEDNTPPMTWRLAVIDKIHPGVDGLVRVATVRTTQGLFKRPIHKLCPLPFPDNEKAL